MLAILLVLLGALMAVRYPINFVISIGFLYFFQYMGWVTFIGNFWITIAAVALAMILVEWLLAGPVHPSSNGLYVPLVAGGIHSSDDSECGAILDWGYHEPSAGIGETPTVENWHVHHILIQFRMIVIGVTLLILGGLLTLIGLLGLIGSLWTGLSTGSNIWEVFISSLAGSIVSGLAIAVGLLVTTAGVAFFAVGMFLQTT